LNIVAGQCYLKQVIGAQGVGKAQGRGVLGESGVEGVGGTGRIDLGHGMGGSFATDDPDAQIGYPGGDVVL
jgi:hypothetical protein